MARVILAVLGALIGGAASGVCGAAVCVFSLYFLGVRGRPQDAPPGISFGFCVGAIWGAWVVGRAFWSAGSKRFVGILCGTGALTLTGLPLFFLVQWDKGSEGAVFAWLALCLLTLEVPLLRWFGNLRAWQLLVSITLFIFILGPVMALYFAATMHPNTHPGPELVAIVFTVELWVILAGAALAAEAICWVYTRLSNLDREWRQN